ncbi:MAG TPA: polyprenyl synthetase family protein, partial [Oceanipulchritudo sp.]|nr:polyprenyl synthetase family protein [Oceanipulchritudo sp.]
GYQPAPPTANERFQLLVEPLQPAFEALEAFLEEQVGSFEPEVQPLVRYCFGHSGKKLRPILVFSMAGGTGEAPRPEIIKAAAIVELVHLATLVHDDILDEAEVRHRTETVVSRYGPHVAVLLGDALFSHALHLAAQFPEVEVCKTVSLATRQVCSGEIAQTFARGADVPDPEAYFRMIDLKTAELFTVSAYLGGYLSGFSKEALEAARAFARHLGIAYQIYDDAADIFAEEAVAGKTLGTDLATGKFTLPVLLWLDAMEPAQRQSMVGSLRAGENGRLDVRQSLMEADILRQVGEAFFHQLDLSNRAIANIPGEERQAQLRVLAEFVAMAWNKFSIR